MNEVEQLRANALSEKLRLLKDAGLSIGENALAFGSGMATDAVAGLRGLGEYVTPDMTSWDERKRKGAEAVEKTREQLSPFVYQPQADVSQRGQENVGGVFEHVGNAVNDMYGKPLAESGLPLAPELATAGVVGLNVLGPKGKPKGVPKAKPHTPRFDPGSPQQLIPGVEPLTLDQAHAQARSELLKAQEAMTFQDRNLGLNFDYDPNWRGNGPAYEMNMPDVPTAAEGEVGYVGGKRPVGRISQRPIELGYLEVGDQPGTRTVPVGDYVSPNTVQAEVGPENFQRMLALSERLRAAEGEAHTRGSEALTTRARDIEARVNRRRALLDDPGINDEQRLALNEEILRLRRQQPINMSGHLVEPTPTDEGMFSRLRWSDPLGADATPEVREYLRDRPGYFDIQKRTVRRLRGEPEEEPYTPRTTPHGAAMEDIEGRDPNAMNRQAINDFLVGGRRNPKLFQYGVMPGQEVQTLDDFARHFSRESGEPLRVRHDYADSESDEPYKIKVPKEHGRGEIMRDSYGDFISRQKEHPRGNYPMYDERGDPKMVEVAGPLPKGEEGPLLKKERAAGGEIKRDSYGDPKYEYEKSEGGEPMRDERGNIKKEERENPDYRESSEIDQATISSPHGHITIGYDDPEASITATSAGKKGGALLYQTALSHASRAGIKVGGGSLTDINSYRLLGNTLSNIARTGVNPRDLGGTSAGRAQRARGRAEGPEVWRADAEEARERLLGRGVDPDRVKFDPEKGFSIDGKPASPDDVSAKIGELSPNAGARGSYGGVGQKSLMRNAVFEWLRHATPEQARAVAEKWPKEWGPIFAGITALAAGVGALKDETPELTD